MAIDFIYRVLFDIIFIDMQQYNHSCHQKETNEKNPEKNFFKVSPKFLHPTCKGSLDHNAIPVIVTEFINLAGLILAG